VTAQGGGPTKPKRGIRGYSWRTIVVVILAIYAFLLIILNSGRVKVDFVFVDARTSVFVLVLVSIALGTLIMWLAPHIRERRKRGSQK
jgi:uncharacterized integral membrane protein